MTKFQVSFILKFSPSNWKTFEKCQNFNHHKIENDSSPSYGTTFQKCHFFYHHKTVGANQSCPNCLLPKLQVLDGAHGYLYTRWVRLNRNFQKEHQAAKGKKVYNIYRLQ
jgi:hypothetical protein